MQPPSCYKVAHIIKEIGISVNDTRPKLTRLLGLTDYGVLLVEHKDRDRAVWQRLYGIVTKSTWCEIRNY